ncbi:hypothetical protein KKC45_00435, partial [Patescibacteria group bacterium]|nr:hypothetical protein [Patescibacteria group bacterium]
FIKIWKGLSNQAKNEAANTKDLGASNLELITTPGGQVRLEQNGKLKLAYNESGFYSYEKERKFNKA